MCSSDLPAAQITSEKSMDQVIQSELKTQIPDGQAKLMIFSNTDWSGAFQSSSFDYTEINGNSDEEVTFGCESSFGRQGVFGAKDRKSTRLNSSHKPISYAVFCSKKKKTNNRFLSGAS